MKVERLMNLIEEYMAHATESALMRRKDKHSGVLLIVYSYNTAEFVAQTLRALYTFMGIEAPTQWFAYLAGQEVATMQAVKEGHLADAFEILTKMTDAELAGDSAGLHTLAKQLEEVLNEQAG